MFAVFGAGGQALYNRLDAQHLEEAGKEEVVDGKGKGWKGSWLDSKWSPMKVLSDAEYEDMLQEKLLKVNAEIALVDESIEALRGQERELQMKEMKEKGLVSEVMGAGKGVEKKEGVSEAVGKKKTGWWL